MLGNRPMMASVSSRGAIGSVRVGRAADGVEFGTSASAKVTLSGEGALVVPTGAVAHHDGVRILVQGIGEVCEKQVHDLGVDARHHQGDVVAGVRAHGGEDVGPLVEFDASRGPLAPAPHR